MNPATRWVRVTEDAFAARCDAPGHGKGDAVNEQSPCPVCGRV